jgi:hypothetical protein
METKYEPDSYESLQSYSQDTNFLELVINTLSGIQESQNPDQQVQLVKELRRIRKFDQNFFENIFNNVVNHFERYIKSSDIQVAKESLTLAYEIFSYYKYEGPLKDWLAYLIPPVIEQTTSHVQQVKLLAVSAVANLSENMFYSETAEILTELIFDSESEEQAVNAKNAFIGIIKFIDEESLVHELNWANFFCSVDGFLKDNCNNDGNKLKRMDYIVEIIANVQGKFGERFNYFLNAWGDYAEMCLQIMNRNY